MIRALPFVACFVFGSSLVALAMTTADCSSCGGVACPFGSAFTIDSTVCIASVDSDCPTKVGKCGDGGSGAGASVFPPEDGGTCSVTTTLEDGTTITTQVHWSLHTKADECCPATYQADPPSLTIGATDAGAPGD